MPTVRLRPAPAPRLHAFIALCLLTGVRSEEARALTWEHVDLDAGTISVWRSVPAHGVARLAGHASSQATEAIYRRELRPVITTGAEVM